ncbi:MAG: NAD(P)/FAD-dependent oxidoreductase [Bacteroidales bacterium]|nr:NAD(P)/FAD-dependent oxidoreductase [Bacteroidales bacterium]
MKFDAVILGSGLGGLECGFILSKCGMNVCVLEKNAALGGCLQSFRRGKDEFDTGFHYVGALGKGQILEKIFSHLGLMDLPWHQLDTDGFDQVFFKDKSYLLANGYERFADQLSASFPRCRERLKSYSSFLEKVGKGIAKPILEDKEGFYTFNSLFEQSAYKYLSDTLGNKLLTDIVSASSLKLELCSESLPLYTFAQINSSFIQSAWKLKGRGSLIADTLAEGIRKMGGTVLSRAEVTYLEEKDGRICGATILHNGSSEKIEGNLFVSGLSPQLTLELLKDSPNIRPIFRRRINSLEQTCGFFTVNLKLKEGRIPYLNRNIYYYSPETDSVWDIALNTEKKPVCGILISQQVPQSGSFATQMDILTPMSFSEVSRWKDTIPNHRGEEYRAFKAKKAEECIALAQNCFPNLSDAVEACYTSTPLTYLNYTGAVKGTAYGIRKDFKDPTRTLLTPKTPFQNLFFTGQNLNLHGILGVSLTSLLTCSEILGKETVVPFLE